MLYMVNFAEKISVEVQYFIHSVLYNYNYLFTQSS